MQRWQVTLSTLAVVLTIAAMVGIVNLLQQFFGFEVGLAIAVGGFVLCVAVGTDLLANRKVKK